MRGQQELSESGLLHYQGKCDCSLTLVMVAYPKKVSLQGVKRDFGECHAELSRSDASRSYVWKDDTRVDGTQFEYGVLSMRRNEPTDWVAVRDAAKQGDFSEVPADVFVRNYFQLQRISRDHLSPSAQVRHCSVYWGRTGTGKSLRAWTEATMEAYPKDPNTKVILRSNFSFGMVTKAITTLLSMNFGVVSQSPICFDGSTVIQSLWKLRGRAFAFEPVASGSLQM